MSGRVIPKDKDYPRLSKATSGLSKILILRSLT